MRKLCTTTILLSLIFASSCKNDTMKNTDAKIPTADKQPITLEKHGDVRIDNYFWMRLTDEQKLDDVKDDQTQKVINYLEEENTYHDKVTEFSKNFEETLFEAETIIKYDGYISRQKEEIEKLKIYENMLIPKSFDYKEITSISNEGREKLSSVLPETVGQAQRIPGIRPTDISILLVYLKRSFHVKHKNGDKN